MNYKGVSMILQERSAGHLNWSSPLKLLFQIVELCITLSNFRSSIVTPHLL